MPDSIHRRYFTMSSTITGPVLTRIWNTPRRAYAQKFKHVIEPTLTLSRVTPIENYDNIVKLDSPDYVVGRVTSVAYGVNNRLYAKKESAREILTVAISQSYYTDENAAAVDRQFQSSDFTTALKPSHFSPVAMQVHVSPTTVTDVTFRTEYDTQVHALRSLAANGALAIGWAVANAGMERQPLHSRAGRQPVERLALSQRQHGHPQAGERVQHHLRLQLRHEDQGLPQPADHRALQLAVLRHRGRVPEVQFRHARRRPSACPRDHRFNLSFTLAGIGTFSDLFGAFGGQQGR